MKILFFSDPHVGVNRQAHTTAYSRWRMREELLKHLGTQVLSQVMIGQTPVAMGNATLYVGGEPATVVCAGDFFDTFSNDETLILSAAGLFRQVDLCLAGNHDVVNDATKRGSLDLISKLAENTEVVRSEFGKTLFHVERLPSTDLYLIPHHSSSTLFEETLQEVYNLCQERKSEATSILVLHCNYDQPTVGVTDTAQNLTREDAHILLEVFDYVLLGHEHHPASYYDGRLRIIGNTFPTHFGDISDKQVLVYDPDTGAMESVKVWDKSGGYVELPAAALLESGEIALAHSVQFVEVTGNVAVDQVAALKRAISDKVWAPYVDQLLAVKDNTGTLRDEKEVHAGLQTGELVSLPQRIDKSLQGTDMYPLWKELYDRHRESYSD